MDVLPQLARAAAGGRARGGPAPAPERLGELAHAVRRGEYEVPAELVAEALIRAVKDPWAARS